MKKILNLTVAAVLISSTALSAERISTKSTVLDSNLKKKATSVYLMPFGTEVRTARDERGNLTNVTNTSLSLGLGFGLHEIWFEKMGTQKSESASGSLNIRNKSDEMDLFYRYTFYQRSQALRFSAGAGILQRQAVSTTSLLGGALSEDKTGAITEPLLLASVNGKLSVFFYDLGLKSLFIKGADPSPTLALSARAGLSFNF